MIKKSLETVSKKVRSVKDGEEDGAKVIEFATEVNKKTEEMSASLKGAVDAAVVQEDLEESQGDGVETEGLSEVVAESQKVADDTGLEVVVVAVEAQLKTGVIQFSKLLMAVIL